MDSNKYELYSKGFEGLVFSFQCYGLGFRTQGAGSGFRVHGIVINLKHIGEAKASDC